MLASAFFLLLLFSLFFSFFFLYLGSFTYTSRAGFILGVVGGGGGIRPRKKEPQKVAHKRPEPYDALERRVQNIEETRRERSHKKHEKEEDDIKEEQVETALRTSLHKSAQK